jgi:PAS domain S-box-containing protein
MSPQAQAAEIEQLVREISERWDRLQELSAGQLDAVLDPLTGSSLMMRNAQAALQDSEARYRRLVSRVAAVVFELDPLGSTLYVNDAVEAATGYTPAELLGCEWWSTFVALESQGKLAELKAAIDKGDVSGFEIKMKSKSGAPLLFELNTANRYEKNGALSRVVGLATNITERRKAESEIRRLAAIVESTNVAVVGFSLDGSPVSWNSGAQKMYGFTAEEVLSSKNALVMPPSELPRANETIRRVLAGEEVAPFESTRLHKDGHTISVMVTYSPIRDETGKVIGASTIARDITDQKSLEMQLVQAQKLEGIGRLAGGVCHDFNNIIGVIILLSEAELPEKDLRAEFARTAARIRVAAERAAALTRQLMLFARKSVGEAVPVDLRKVLLDIDPMIRRLCGEEIELVSLPCPVPAVVRVDPSQIEQVILNLAVNARDAISDQGSITFGLSIVEDSTPDPARFGNLGRGSYVILSCTDSGSGMTEEVQSHLFEPFFTTKPIGKGTGLGLSTIFGIVKNCGGGIGVKSKVGAGTTFEIALPLTLEALNAFPESGADSVGLRGIETILLVEDSEVLLLTIRGLLQKQGYRVLAAANGLEALKVCERFDGPIDLVLSDVIMPDMRGPELVKKIMKLQPQAKVLFMSGYTDDSMLERSDMVGSGGFIQKPFHSDELSKRIREILDQRI